MNHPGEQPESDYVGQVAEEFRLLKGLGTLLMRALALGPIVFLHTEVGDRFLTVGMAVGGFLCLVAFQLLPGPTLLGWVTLAYCILSIVHRFHAYRQRASGEQIHSYSPGYPWPAWSLISRPTLTRMGLEPLLCFLLALGALRFDGPLSAYLMVAGVAFLGHELTGWRYRRERIKDSQDGVVEGQHITQVLGRRRQASRPSPVRVARRPRA